MEYVELKYLGTCTPDYFNGFSGHVYAVPLCKGDTYGDVLKCLKNLILHEEIEGFNDNYCKIENDCEGLRYAAKEKGYLNSVFNDYINDNDENSETCYAWFGVVCK